MSDKSANVPFVVVRVAADEKSAEVTVRGEKPVTVAMTAAFRAEAIANGIRQAARDAAAPAPKGSADGVKLALIAKKVAAWATTGEWAQKADAAAIRAAAEARAAETAKAKLIESIKAMKLPAEQKEMMIKAVG